MGLEMHCLDFFKEVRIKKKSFGLRILKFFIGYSPYKPMRVYQVSASHPPTSHLSIRSSFAELTHCHNFISSGTRLEPN